MKKPGAKPFEFTADQRAIIKQETAFGATQKELAKMFNCTVKTLAKHCGKELQEGRSWANRAVAKSLFWSATVGKNVTAGIWWEKTRSGMREPTAAQADANKPTTSPPALGISWDRGGPGHGGPAGNFAIDVSTAQGVEHIEPHETAAAPRLEAPPPPAPFRELTKAEQWARLAETSEQVQAREVAAARALSPGEPAETEAEKDARLRHKGREWRHT